MAIDSLKRNKPTGLDTIIAPVHLRLFIFIYDNGVYPEQWANGVTFPIQNEGNVNDVTTTDGQHS